MLEFGHVGVPAGFRHRPKRRADPFVDAPARVALQLHQLQTTAHSTRIRNFRFRMRYTTTNTTTYVRDYKLRSSKMLKNEHTYLTLGTKTSQSVAVVQNIINTPIIRNIAS